MPYKIVHTTLKIFAFSDIVIKTISWFYCRKNVLPFTAITAFKHFGVWLLIYSIKHFFIPIRLLYRTIRPSDHHQQARLVKSLVQGHTNRGGNQTANPLIANSFRHRHCHPTSMWGVTFLPHLATDIAQMVTHMFSVSLHGKTVFEWFSSCCRTKGWFVKSVAITPADSTFAPNPSPGLWIFDFPLDEKDLKPLGLMLASPSLSVYKDCRIFVGLSLCPNFSILRWWTERLFSLTYWKFGRLCFIAFSINVSLDFLLCHFILLLFCCECSLNLRPQNSWTLVLPK